MGKLWKLVGLVLVLSLGCEVEDEPEVGQANFELKYATPTMTRPEVGRINNCSATLIRSQWIITAAHCIDYQYKDGRGNWRFTVSDRYTYLIDAFYPLGEGLGDYDIAIAKLVQPVPAYIATPARLSATYPGSGERMVSFGYGCVEDNDPYPNATTEKRYANFTWDVDGKQRLCPGDSGGPLIRGWLRRGRIYVDSLRVSSPEIAGVNSAVVDRRRRSDYDVFAYPALVVHQVEELIRDVDGGLEMDVDRLGMDYANVTYPPSRYSTLQAAEYCRDLCDFHYRCRSFSLVKSTGQCFLKEATPAVVPNSNVISGVVGGHESGVDRFGGDYACYNVGASLPSRCASDCGRDQRCRSWTFVPPNSSGSARCCLKDRVAPPRRSSLRGGGLAITSGLKMGFEYHMRILGSSYRVLRGNSPPPDWCQSECERDERCVAWSYRARVSGSQAICELKDGAVSQLWPAAEWVAGYKGKVFER
jgi:hypothetical protein